VLALIAGTYRSAEGEEAHVVPGEGAALQIWILGSSGGESAEVAGERGLRFAANYHVSPATVLEAVDGYRAAFKPSTKLERPYVSVSADVVVADTEAAARERAGPPPPVDGRRSRPGRRPLVLGLATCPGARHPVRHPPPGDRPPARMAGFCEGPSDQYRQCIDHHSF
jgi:alkanesulfonate monooxygenase SsuD/methylene tetrahydromethanopterin reductase-like flavin-dependent oxidoreductase (luciferase family)